MIKKIINVVLNFENMSQIEIKISQNVTLERNI